MTWFVLLKWGQPALLDSVLGKFHVKKPDRTTEKQSINRSSVCDWLKRENFLSILYTYFAAKSTFYFAFSYVVMESHTLNPSMFSMPFCIIDLSMWHSHEERLFTPGKYLVHLWKIIMTSGDDCRAYRNRSVIEIEENDVRSFWETVRDVKKKKGSSLSYA